MNTDRVLITGSGGMLGNAVFPYFSSRYQSILATDKDQNESWIELLDIRDGAALRKAFAEVKPNLVLHLAACTDLEFCEVHPDVATETNEAATRDIAALCEEHGSTLVYISTAGVFDGTKTGPYTEDDPAAPLGVYGQSKWEGDEAVRRLLPRHLILRVSWVFGVEGHNFVKTILRLAREREDLRVVADQRGCPTYAEDLADVLAQLVSGRHRGIFHATNHGACTWLDLAREAAIASGADPGRIRPCTSAQFPRPAVRPACSILRSRRLEEAGCPPRPAWQDAVGRYVARLASGQVAHP